MRLHKCRLELFLFPEEEDHREEGRATWQHESGRRRARQNQGFRVTLKDRAAPHRSRDRAVRGPSTSPLLTEGESDY